MRMQATFQITSMKVLKLPYPMGNPDYKESAQGICALSSFSPFLFHN